MKTIKLTKRDLKLDLPALLRKVGLVSGNYTYPSDFYVSKNDAEELRKNLTEKAKKQKNPRIPRSQIAKAVAWEWFNFGPNSSLEDSIKDGYALLDFTNLEEAERKSKNKKD